MLVGLRRSLAGHCTGRRSAMASRGPADARGIVKMARVVAVVGASRSRHKFGNKAVRAFRAAGDTVVPIHPHAAEIEGQRAYASVVDVPGPIDMATVYLPPRVAMTVLPELQRKGIGEVWLNPGADDDAVIDEARRLGLNPSSPAASWARANVRRTSRPPRP